MKRHTISINNLADLVGCSRATVEGWIHKGKYPVYSDSEGKRFFYLSEVAEIPEIAAMQSTKWNEEKQSFPNRVYSSVELFAGGGGLALGMEKAGFKHILLNEFDHNACETLRVNRPDWNVIEGDIHDIDFSPLRGQVDFLSGGFPCQAFSYAGKRLGFEEARGTLFFELARAVREIQPKVFMCENVKGLLEHDKGNTMRVIRNVIDDLGYYLYEPRVLRAIQYDVPQKRERLILIAVRKDLERDFIFEWPDVAPELRTLRDAFYKGALFECDVPVSQGQVYPESKRKVMDLVPEGGDWRDLPDDVAREYMKGSYHLGGGKTGMARRLSMDEPSLTLTCAPAQKQTERCHPLESRPLTVREYARIQTFPDDWSFAGNLTAQYKQIGNAVPVNMAWAIGRSLIRAFNKMTDGRKELNGTNSVFYKLDGLFDGIACEGDTAYE